MDNSLTPPSTALITEDLPATCNWLRDLLTATFPGILLSSADSLASARRLIKQKAFGLALIDLGLPDGNGVELIRDLSQKQPDCIRIVTTIYTDDRHLFPALRAGAQGYLLKDQPPEHVGRALLGVMLGEPPLSPMIARRLLQVFAEPAPADPTHSQLTERESESLALVAKGLKIAEVAEHMGVTANTAAGYIKTVYKKLNVRSRAEATIEAVRMGLVSAEI